MCGNQIVTEQVSPNKKYKAVVYVRDCGATTGFSTQVSILRNNKKLRDDESGNVLTLSDHYYGQYKNYYGGAEVKVMWITNNKLLVHFDSKAEAGIKKNKIDGIEVAYEQIQ